MNVTACAEELAIVTGGAAPAIERIIRKYINEGLRVADHAVTRAARQELAVNAIRNATNDMLRIMLIQDFVLSLEHVSGVDLSTAGRVLNTPRKGTGFALESDELYRPRLIAAARAL